MTERITAEKDVTNLPVPGEYWTRPVAASRGDPDSLNIYAAIGMALTTWERVENDFAWLYKIFIESDSRAAVRAYGAIQSAGGRRDAIEQAAEVYFIRQKIDDKMRAKFKRLLEHFKQASTRRNEIAHGYVVTVEIETNDRGSFLVPPDYNSRKTEPFPSRTPDDEYSFLGTDYRYVSADIHQFGGKFARLREAALRYSFTVTGTL